MVGRPTQRRRDLFAHSVFDDDGPRPVTLPPVSGFDSELFDTRLWIRGLHQQIGA